MISFVVVASHAQEEVARQVGLLFAGKFEKADITSDVRGTKKTQLAAAYTWSYGVRLFTDETWKESGFAWEGFATRAAALADDLAGKIKPQYIRDSRGVIEYAIVSDESPFISSVLTSPVFLEPFADTLGEKLNVIVVDRNVLYVFPGIGGKLADFGPALARTFQSTPMPVSLEVFEVDKSGFRVIGEIERAPRKAELEVIKNLLPQ